MPEARGIAYETMCCLDVVFYHFQKKFETYYSILLLHIQRVQIADYMSLSFACACTGSSSLSSGYPGKPVF